MQALVAMAKLIIAAAAAVMSTYHTLIHHNPLPVIGAVLLILILRWRKNTSSSSDLPPGNLGLPFLGETLQFLASAKSNRPWDFFYYRQMRYGPVFKTHIFGQPTVVMDAPSGNHFLFANHGKLVVTAWPDHMKQLFGQNGLFFLQDSDAKHVRGLFLSFLGPDAMQRYVGKMSRIVEQHLQECWAGRQQVKAYLLVREALFSLICSSFLGIEDKQQLQKLLKPSTDIFFGMLEVPLDLPWMAFHGAKRGRKLLMDEVEHIMRVRRMELQQGKASERQDLLSALLTDRDESGNVMSDEEIKDSLLIILVSGHNTTAIAVCNAMKFLAENPASYKLMLEEHLKIASMKQNSPLNWSHVRQMRYTWRVLQETIRLFPPAQGVLKQAISNIQFGKYEIPKGWKVLLSVHNSHRKEQFFHDPHKFDPTRFEGLGPLPNTYVPFGGGPRGCPGIELVKAQALVFLHHLILGIQWILVDPNEKMVCQPAPRPKNDLHLYISPKI